MARNALGLPNRMRTPDRDTLEQVILHDMRVRKILR